MKMAVYLLLSLLALLMTFFLYLLVILIQSTLTEYKPPPVTRLQATEASPVAHIPAGQTSFDLLTWNIGYAGLGREMDFFYEGGKKCRPPKTEYRRYLDGIMDFLEKNSQADFILLQEVDLDSRRSFGIDQARLISREMPDFSSATAINYKVSLVPMPLFNPMGKVCSGLATFSRYPPASSERYGFRSNYAWPMRLFQLKRCVLLSRFALASGKELVVFNIHNSAFDDAAAMREEQMQGIRKWMEDEYRAGNYVVAGGDWNQSPPGADAGDVPADYLMRPVRPLDRHCFPEGWTIAFDPSCPTNRKVDKPFIKGTTPTTLIDYFICSPNLDVVAVKTCDLAFACSDHHPVLIRIRLKG
jgi:endonuclease/exonuclease/phosphatase family metal-dependent hydrolase